MSKKVLILNTTFNQGGAANLAHDLFIKFRNDQDLSLYFAYGRGKKSLEPNTYYFGNKLESFFHLILVRFLGLEGFGTYFATKKLINFIAKEKFDLIHIHNLHGYYLNFFQLLNYLQQQNIKVAWTLHDEWLFTWLPAHSLGCTHCHTLLGKCSNQYGYPKNYFPVFSHFMLKKKRSILSLSNISFISPAEWLYEKARNEFNLSNIALIPNGVDLNVFKPADNKSDLRKKYGLPLNKKIVLFSANNLRDKNKGGSYFLKLVETFRHNPDYIFCLVGSSRLPRVKNLISLGYISDAKKMAEIYALADLYCFFSAAETSPLSVLEATACGLPILAFKIKALEYLLFGEGNLLVEYGNTGLMLESFKKFFSSDYSPTKKNSALSRPDEMFSSYREVYLASF